MRKLRRGFNWIKAIFKCWIRGCKEFRYQKRWIKITEKKNKPAPTLLEYLKVCVQCNQVSSSYYLAEDEYQRLCSSKSRR